MRVKKEICINIKFHFHIFINPTTNFISNEVKFELLLINRKLCNINGLGQEKVGPI